jgi:hypothetical protein
MECLRVCPTDNIAVNLRPWGSDLGPKNKHRLGEAFLGLVMLASVLVDSAVFLGPWGQLKLAAYTIGSRPWFLFAAAFLFTALAILPGLYASAVWTAEHLGTARKSFQKELSKYGQVLIPLGLMAWIAFTVSFAFAKFSYVLPVISDPFGWGWNLIGLSAAAWVGQTTTFSLLLQVILLSIGLFWASRVARQNSESAKQAMPLIAFCGLFTISMFWLLIG